MAMKKIKDMDHYEILNVGRSASQQEIKNAYLQGKAAYAKGSLAHYTLISDKERQQMLDRIETAFFILGNPEKRSAYDKSAIKKDGIYQEKAYFRQSTERMVIEDFKEKAGSKFLKHFFSASKKKQD